MRNLTKAAAAMASAAVMAAAPVASLADTTLGLWQTTKRNMDYAVTLCGQNNDELCATLTAVRGSGDRPRTRKYLGKLVVDHAKPTGKNRWRGTAVYLNYDVTGDIVYVPGQSFTVKGCALLIVCGELTLIPAK